MKKLPLLPEEWLEMLDRLVRPGDPLGPDHTDAQLRHELGRRSLLEEIRRLRAAQESEDPAAWPRL